jgi:uncharacterized protein YqeY
MPSLEDRIAADMKSALKEGRKHELHTLRLLRSEILLAAKSTGRPLEEADVLSVLQKAARKREESIAAYRQGGRTDLVEAERAELDIIRGYLPAPLSSAELEVLVRGVIGEVGAESPRDMGVVMKAVMPRVAGRADGRQVNTLVRDLLSRSAAPDA